MNETKDRAAEESPRYSIWSVNAEWIAAYFVAFEALGIVGAAYIVWFHTTQQTSDTLHETITAIIMGVTAVGAGAAFVSFIWRSHQLPKRADAHALGLQRLLQRARHLHRAGRVSV